MVVKSVLNLSREHENETTKRTRFAQINERMYAVQTANISNVLCRDIYRYTYD